MTALEFAVYALATWRVASFLAEESGPWNVLDKLRFVLGIRYDEHNYPYGKNELADNLVCIWCATPYVGLAWALFAFFAPTIAFWCAMPFALSTVAIIINARGVRFRKRT